MFGSFYKYTSSNPLRDSKSKRSRRSHVLSRMMARRQVSPVSPMPSGETVAPNHVKNTPTPKDSRSESPLPPFNNSRVFPLSDEVQVVSEQRCINACFWSFFSYSASCFVPKPTISIEINDNVVEKVTSQI